MKRLDILNAIEAGLNQITIVNGYSSDIGNNVNYWSDLPWEFGEVGGITFQDPEEETIEVGLLHEHSLSIEIEAIAFTDNPKVKGIELLNDIKTAIALDLTWGGLALRTVLGGNDKNIQTSGQTAVRIYVQIEVVYRTERFET